jgi:hypothetical protein
MIEVVETGTGSSRASCRRRCASICPPPCSSVRPCDRDTDLGAHVCRPPPFDARPATPDRAPAGAGERRPGRQSGRRSADVGRIHPGRCALAQR